MYFPMGGRGMMGVGGMPMMGMGMGQPGGAGGQQDGLTPDQEMYYEQRRRRIQSLIDRNPNGDNMHVLIRGLDNLADRWQREMNIYQAWQRRLPGEAAGRPVPPPPWSQQGQPQQQQPRPTPTTVSQIAGAPASERSAAPERSQARSSRAAP
jgi:hypothetical protein